jgi:pimeloyl-ACP methyl ester carboxylesterase
MHTAAGQIASNGDCLDAIEQLSQATRIHERSYIFLIGHSFGGLILERTVEHTMPTLQGQKGKPPWDLALILNPASDSVLVKQLVRDLESLYRYDPRPVPDSPLKWAGRYEVSEFPQGSDAFDYNLQNIPKTAYFTRALQRTRRPPQTLGGSPNRRPQHWF